MLRVAGSAGEFHDFVHPRRPAVGGANLVEILVGGGPEVLLQEQLALLLRLDLRLDVLRHLRLSLFHVLLELHSLVDVCRLDVNPLVHLEVGLVHVPRGVSHREPYVVQQAVRARIGDVREPLLQRRTVHDVYPRADSPARASSNLRRRRAEPVNLAAELVQHRRFAALTARVLRRHHVRGELPHVFRDVERQQRLVRVENRF
mmetsp:Transcript_11764/g.49434  ORF Transcript_11764/g.49434 Transcript_11764/m.49434 type:complete len:203 (-) Transcript_11764:1192-1800(-)